MEPLFEVHTLSVGYDSPLLTEVSFSLHAGEIVAILGRNGCGKTTLLRGLSGSIRRFSGQILVKGRNCAAMKPRQQAACISLLPQQTEVLGGITAHQLIEMGRYPYAGPLGSTSAWDQALIQKTARLLGISELLDRDCAKLSQGQRQLVLLCRLLVQDTPVMLLDEPNAALDYDNHFTMFRILQDAVTNQEKAALLVLHDPELALAFCHRVLIVKDGHLAADLSPAQSSPTALQQALQLIYPHILLRKDPFDGRFRCYHQ